MVISCKNYIAHCLKPHGLDKESSSKQIPKKEIPRSLPGAAVFAPVQI